MASGRKGGMETTIEVGMKEGIGKGMSLERGGVLAVCAARGIGILDCAPRRV